MYIYAAQGARQHETPLELIKMLISCSRVDKWIHDIIYAFVFAVHH